MKKKTWRVYEMSAGRLVRSFVRQESAMSFARKNVGTGEDIDAPMIVVRIPFNPPAQVGDGSDLVRLSTGGLRAIRREVTS